MKSKEELMEELNIYKERLEDAMEGGDLAWWEMELPSGEIKFNKRKTDMLDRDPDDFKHYQDFVDLLHPEDKDKAMDAMRDHLEGKAERYEVEYRIERKDGDYIWFRDIGQITESEGENKKVTGIVININERKKAEEREELLNSLLRHDIKNKIQIIQGYLQLLEDEVEVSDKAKEYLKKMKEEDNASMNLIEKVRLIKQAEEEKNESIDLCSSVKEAVKNRENLADDNEVNIQMECPPEGYLVKAGTLLKEVFSNIIENSIQHSEGSVIRISSDIKNNEIMIIIEDDGKGISDDKKNTIFEKGYTTDKERGSGLGMFLVKMLLNSYDGNIEVKDSELGGARFDVHLKRA